jgi:hypothetical protein
VPPGLRLPDSDPSTIVSGPVLPWLPQYIFDLVLIYVMAVDVRFSSFRVKVEADIH